MGSQLDGLIKPIARGVGQMNQLHKGIRCYLVANNRRSAACSGSDFVVTSFALMCVSTSVSLFG